MPALSWGGLRNARDLGGLPCREGAVSPGALLRTERLARLDPAGVAAYAAAGVARVIDLRFAEEAAREPHPVADDPAYVFSPWIDVDRDHERLPDHELVLSALYRGSLDRNVRTVAAAVRAFVAAPPGPVLVHCVAGKDRTGLFVAVLLDLVGVPREEIAADYALSEVNLGLDGPDADDFQRTRPETILAALAHLDATYGGSAGYLRDACGLSDAEVAGCRDRLVPRGG